MGQYFEFIFRTCGPKGFVRCHTVRVDNLPFCGVNDGVGNIAGTSLGKGGEGHHRCRGTHIAFTRAYQPLIIQFMESEAGIGVNMAAIKAAETVDGDGVRVVFFEYSLLREVHGGRRLQGFPGNVFQF